MEVGRWSEGRPVYKKVDGETERVLFVPEGYVNWQIKESTSSTGYSLIGSGRGTNSPGSSEAGASDRFGWTRWHYDNNGKLKEGDISVSCIQE